MEWASLLPVVGCAAMGVMMWLMMRGRRHSGQVAQPESGTAEEIAALRAEIAELRAQRATDTEAAADQAR